MKSTLSVAATLALISSTSAHLFIKSPTPIPGSATKNPLDASGDDFPCHGATLPGTGGTSMAVGSQQLLQFDGGANGENTAVHGGGSCQISITYETDAQKIKDPSNWKVLYSLIGGCPTNSPMNLDSGYTGPSGSYSGALQCSDPKTNGYDCLNQFNFSIPEGVKNGPATLAWTWFNNVGNREMYMNCVAVDITGGGNDASAMSSLPNLFVANVAATGVSSSCKTTERQNVLFPDPGKNVISHPADPRMKVATATDYPIVMPSGCGAASGGSGSSPTTATSAAGGSNPTTAAATTAPATTAPAQVPTTASATTLATTAGGKKTTAAAGKKTSLVKRPPVATTTKGGFQAAVGTGTAVTPVQPTASASSGTCASGSVSCSSPSTLVCVDANHFGICDINMCAVVQSVAPGTACIGSGITWATSNKRRHIARHAHGLFRHGSA